MSTCADLVNDHIVRVIKENIENIHRSFANLMIKVTDKLKNKVIDLKKFRLYILTSFNTGDILDGKESVADIMEALSCRKLWDYSCFTRIEGLVKDFGGEDKELAGWIRDYKSELAGFKATTKIVDYIKVYSAEQEIADSSQSLRENMARYDHQYCHKLTGKLKSHVMREKTLDYVDELWRSIADHFLLPSLPALLDSIHEGCVEVTWLVPTLSALQIKANIQDSTEFLNELEVIKVIVDDKTLYSIDKVRICSD